MIYFVLNPITGAIKIGKAKDVANRLVGLRREHGKSLEVMATAEGSYQEESSLHRRFRHLRLDEPGREWFRPEPELIDFIEQLGVNSPILVDQNPDVRPSEGRRHPHTRRRTFRLDKQTVAKIKALAAVMGIEAGRTLNATDAVKAALAEACERRGIGPKDTKPRGKP